MSIVAALIRVALYVRLSRDAEGLRLGAGRQREDLDRDADESGYVVVARYEDNDISASTRTKKRRPAYEAMIAAAKAGEFDVIVAYTSSRLTRRPRENEDLIDLAEKHGIKFRYLRSPSFDLNTADGRNIARILAANDAAESERIAERVARAAAQRAKEGKFHGGSPPFGYRVVKDAAGKIAAWEPEPEDADLVADIADRLLAGESLYGICTSLHKAGNRTARGAAWRPKGIKRLVTSPAVAGFRLHDGELVRASWEPIIDPKDWERLRTLLGDEARQQRPWTATDTRRKYLLVGIARCGNPGCGKPLSSMTSAKERGNYVALFCSTIANSGCGHLRIKNDSFEEYVTEMFFSAIDGLVLPGRTAGHDPESEAELSATYERLRKSITADENTLEQVDNDHYDGLLKRPEWMKQRRRLSDRIEVNQEQLLKVTAEMAQIKLPPAEELRRQWPHRDVAWRRTMILGAIDHVVVKPFPPGMASTLTARKGETDESLQERREEHLAKILRQRVEVVWRA